MGLLFDPVTDRTVTQGRESPGGVCEGRRQEGLS